MRKSNGFSARQLTNSDLHPLLCGVAFNPFENAVEALINSPLIGKELALKFTPYEIKTLRLYDGKAEENYITEKPLD